MCVCVCQIVVVVFESAVVLHLRVSLARERQCVVGSTVEYSVKEREGRAFVACNVRILCVCDELG